MDSQSNTIPSFLKKKQIKLGGEENDKLLELNNDINKNDINAENTAEKVKFLFPNLSQKIHPARACRFDRRPCRYLYFWHSVQDPDVQLLYDRSFGATGQF